MQIIEMEETGEIEIISGCKRRMLITLDFTKIAQATQSRINNIAKTVRVPGFRPGRAQSATVGRQYRSQIRGQIIAQKRGSQFHKTLREEKVEAIGEPAYMLVKDDASGVQYSATFEVFPHIELKPLSQAVIPEYTQENKKVMVLYSLLQLADFEAPDVLVDADYSRTVLGASLNTSPALLRDQSVGRVKLGLIMKHLIVEHKLTIDPNELKDAVEAFAANYADPDATFEWYYSEYTRLANMEASLLEDKVVQLVLASQED